MKIKQNKKQRKTKETKWKRMKPNENKRNQMKIDKTQMKPDWNWLKLKKPE